MVRRRPLALAATNSGTVTGRSSRTSAENGDGATADMAELPCAQETACDSGRPPGGERPCANGPPFHYKGSCDRPANYGVRMIKRGRRQVNGDRADGWAL